MVDCMEKRYIGENRYKKSSSRKRRSIKVSKSAQQPKQIKKTKNKKKNKRKNNINNIIICLTFTDSYIYFYDYRHKIINCVCNFLLILWKS